MNKPALDVRQLRHDLRSLIEPLDTVKMLLQSNKVEQAVRIQSAALDSLKKLLQSIDEAATDKSGGET